MASGSIRERKTKKGNSWQITIEDGSDPITGERNRMYHTFHGTRKQAEKEMNRLINEIEHGGQITKAASVKLSDWVQQWLELYCTHLSETTQTGYQTAVERWLNPYLGDIQLKQLRNQHIQGWVNTLRDERGLSPKTIKEVFLNLRSALNQACTLNMLAYNPCKGTKLPKLEKYEANIYDEEEIKQLLECARNTEMYFPLLLEISTGLRRGELLAVTWDDVDWDAHTIHIHRNRVATKNGVIIKQPKSKAGNRVLNVGSHLMDVLKWEYSRYQCAMADDPYGFTDSRLMIHQGNGKPYHPQSWTKKWKRFQATTGLDMNRWHDLRHSHTTALLSAGVDLKTIQTRLGHSDITMTLSVYAHATKKSQKEAADKIDSFIFDADRKEA